MINGIHMVDFANHRDTRLLFGKMTALVGQNGAGKTSVMRALLEIHRLMNSNEKGISQYFDRRGKDGTTTLSASWDCIEEESDVIWGLRINQEPDLWIRRKPALEDAKHSWLPNPYLQLENHEWNRAASATRHGFMRPLEEMELGELEFRTAGHVHWFCQYFKTNARILQGPSYSESSRPVLGEDGTGFAWTLSYLMTAEPDKFAAIMASLKEVVPVVKRVRARPVQLSKLEKKSIVINKQEKTYDETQPVMGQELLFDMVSGDSLPASAVSEGTLVTLAILTLVHGSEDVDLIMLDDVELGLHPKAQRDLIQQLRRLQEIRPNLQIIISTHSPYVVDEFEPEDVYLFAPDEEGCAVSARLSDHPDAKRAMETLTTGEFWSAEGEEWVLDKSKASEAVTA